MSLILDALRRSERERVDQQAPRHALEQLARPAVSRRHPRGFARIVMIVVLLGVVGLAIAWSVTRDRPGTVANRNDSLSVDVAPPIESPRNTESSKPPGTSSTPRPNDGAIQAPPERVPGAEAVQTTVSDLQALPSVPPRALAEETRVQRPRPSPPEPTVRMDDGEPPRPSAEPSDPTKLSAAAPELRARLAGFEINTHYFTQEPGRAFALINMRKYRVGDVLERTTFRVRAITPNGVVVDDGRDAVLLEVAPD